MSFLGVRKSKPERALRFSHNLQLLDDKNFSFRMAHDLPQKRAQDLGGRKGLSLDGTPISRGSLWAFCRQKVFKSAAAWDTYKGTVHKTSESVKKLEKTHCRTTVGYRGLVTTLQRELMNIDESTISRDKKSTTLNCLEGTQDTGRQSGVKVKTI